MLVVNMKMINMQTTRKHIDSEHTEIEPREDRPVSRTVTCVKERLTLHTILDKKYGLLDQLFSSLDRLLKNY